MSPIILANDYNLNIHLSIFPRIQNQWVGKYDCVSCLFTDHLNWYFDPIKSIYPRCGIWSILDNCSNYLRSLILRFIEMRKATLSYFLRRFRLIMPNVSHMFGRVTIVQRILVKGNEGTCVTLCTCRSKRDSPQEGKCLANSSFKPATLWWPWLSTKSHTEKTPIGVEQSHECNPCKLLKARVPRGGFRGTKGGFLYGT